MSAPTVITTTNQTNFGLAFADATALVLDGLPSIGSTRAVKFEQAKGRATTALGYTDNPEEQFLARQLLAYLSVAEQQRWNY